jgi:magnesium chelatase family protein
VNAARQLQSQRFAEEKTVHCNAQMGPKLLKTHCPLNEQSTSLLYQAIDRLGLSARAYTRILKISSTIADLDNVANILSSHIAEAIQYRRMQYGPA